MTNLELPLPLLSSLREGRVVLVLGAGAARGAIHPAGGTMPLGAQLGERIADKFLEPGLRTRALTQIAELAISESDLVTVQEFIADQFRLFEPAPFHRGLAQIPWKAIATTNYDLIIERAYEDTNAIQDLVPFVRDGQRVEDRLTSRRSLQYLKLHGCISVTNDETLPLILTTEQYASHRKGRQRLFNRLRELAWEYPILFVGHSLADPDIRALLVEMEEQGEARPRSYVAVPTMTQAEVRYWQARSFAVIPASLQSLVETVLASAMQGTFALVPEIIADHPLSKHLKTSAPIPSSVLSFIDERCELVHPNLRAENANPSAFYAGRLEGWAPIVNELDIARTLLNRLLEQVVLPDESERESLQELFVISGHAGAGKSVLLRRLAWDSAVEFERLCLFVQRYSELEFEHIRELFRLTGKRVYLFFDRAAANRETIVRALRDARRERVPLTIVTTERPHSMHAAGEGLSEEITAEYELRYLSEDEIEALLERLERFHALGRLLPLSMPERVKAFTERAGRQLLVALHEATLGKPFEAIVADEYQSINSPTAQALYRTISLVHRLGVPLRAGVLARVHGIAFSAFKERFFQPLDRIVFARLDPVIGDYVYETRHSVIAEMVFEQILVDERERHDEYERVLSALDIDFAADREAMRGLTRARDLQRIFPTKQLALNVIQVAQKRATADARLVQQEALVHMNWPGPDLVAAEALLKRAAAMADYDAPIKHSLAELLLKRSEAETNLLERQHLRRQARQACNDLLARPRRNSFPYHTLLKLALDEIKDTADADSPALVTERVKDAEQLLTRAKEAFPDDSHILDADARLSEFLNKNTKVLDALTKAFKASPKSTFIALRLATVLQGQGLLEPAKAVLTQCLEANPSDGALHFRLARFLMGPHDLVDEPIRYHLRRSFTRGDSNWQRQFWYARAAFISRDAKEAEEIFRELERADVPHRDQVEPRAFCKDPTGRELRFAGQVDRLYARYGFVVRDSDSSKVFLYCDRCRPGVWQRLRVGHRVTFTLAFNYRGALAADVDRET